MVLQCEQIQCDSEKAEAMKMVAAAVNTQTAVNEGHNARLMAFMMMMMKSSYPSSGT